MKEYLNNNSQLVLPIHTLLTIAGVTVQEPTATCIDRQGFWSTDIIVPIHVVLNGAYAVSVGLGIKQSDTSIALATAASMVTLVTPTVVFTGVGTYATGLTCDLIVKFGIDLNKYNRYVQFDPLVLSVTSATSTGSIGEIVILTDPQKKPQAG